MRASSAYFVGDLHHLLAALLVHFGDAQANDLALGLGIEAEIGLADRLLDRRNHAPVPHLHGQEARLRDAHGRDLGDRHGRAVGIDLKRIEQARRGAAGPQAAEVVLQGIDGALHAALHVTKIERGCRHRFRSLNANMVGR
jgi:hypothetical protein